MTGMKEGAGDNPFAEEGDEVQDADDDSSAEAASTESLSANTGGSMHSGADSDENRQEYPYMLIRDTVKQDRTNDHVYQLRDEYSAHEDALHDEVEELLDDEVYLTDLREAIVATADPDAIAAQLREWGQDIS